jgi:cytochrome b subunit of formate dehydrogenase
LLYMVFEQMSAECGVHFLSSACFICGITEHILMKLIYFKFYVASLGLARTDPT